MGTFIFILLPILYFFYQAYLNFKKEQEKVEKRKQKSFVPATEAKKHESLTEVADDIQNESPFSSKEFYKNKRIEESNKKAELKAERRTTTKSEVKDYYNPEIPVEEVLEGRRIHAVHPHQFEFPHLDVETAVEFDLRNAIVQEAILNRPKY